MQIFVAYFCVFTVLATSLASEAIAQVFKCHVDGTVTYQNRPCPTGAPRKAPTVEQLNAERKKQQLEAASNPSQVANAGSKGQFSASPSAMAMPQAASELARTPYSPKASVTTPASNRCDGRRHCSQMTSCSEAKYFLNNCPGVEMDGDRDGIPCEQQWCM